MQRVLLYNPVSESYTMPLGLMAVGSALAPSDYQVEIYDGRLDRESFFQEVAQGDVLAVGLSVLTGKPIEDALSVSRRVKEIRPEVPVIWGGYFPSEHREVVLRSGLVDALVRGQGELTLLELREALHRGGSLRGIAGLSFVEPGYNDEVVHNPPRGLTDVNQFPPYPNDAIDPHRYLVPTNLGERTLSHNASVGCYERCNFCSITTLYNARWIPERVERVLAQVTRFKEDYGADGIEFFDAHFFPSEKRSLAIAEGLAPLGISWWGQSRVDSIASYRDETLRRLRSSGLGMIFFGAESGSDLVLETMAKNQTVDEILALVRRLRAFDIVPELSFILGAPQDPARDIEASVDFIRRVKREYPATEIIIFLYTPFPQPGLYDDAVAAGFHYPAELLDWTDEPWRSFGLKSPGAPWLSETLRRRVLDFDLVVHSRFPSATDIRLTPPMRRALTLLGSWRYRLGFYRYPYELKLLNRLVSYRAPELEGA